MRFLGFTLAILGIGGLAGWTEQGTGLGLSVICLICGIFFLWIDSYMNQIDRTWRELERRKRRAKR